MNQARIDPEFLPALEHASQRGELVRFLLHYVGGNGAAHYEECVNQLEHALQAAALAQRDHAPPAEVAAALLHDFGHFVMSEGDPDSDFQEQDWRHETIGADLLEPYFTAAVIEPIRMHVPAKRYLCKVDASYHAALSRASQISLELQGGPMSDEERTAFESQPHYEAAVRLRRWDDLAKVQGLATPELDEFADVLHASMKQGAS